MADEFCQVKVGELESQTVLSGQHSYNEEHQHGGNAELGADLIGKDGDENKYGEEQQEVAGLQVYGKHLLED